MTQDELMEPKQDFETTARSEMMRAFIAPHDDPDVGALDDYKWLTRILAAHNRAMWELVVKELYQVHDNKYKSEPCSFCMGEASSLDHELLTDRLAHYQQLLNKGKKEQNS